MAVIIIAIYGIISINTGQEGDSPKETERRQGQSGVESEWEVRENEKGEKYCYHITSKDSSPEPETTKSGSESEELEPESATSELELSETEPKQESEKTEPANSAESTGDTGKDSEEQNEPNKDNAIQNQEQITEEQSADNQSIPEEKASENLAEDSTEEQWVVKVTDDGVFYCASPDDEPEQQEQQVTFSNSSITKTQGDGKFINSATTTGDGEITYSSNNTNVATVDQKTGEVTIKSAGITEISAIAAETTNYSSASATYILTVNKSQNTTAKSASPTITKCTWKIANGRRYCKDNGKNKTGPFYAKLSSNSKPIWFYGIPDKGYVLMKSDGPHDNGKGYVYIAVNQDGKLLQANESGASGFVMYEKKRYYIDSQGHGCRSGFFTANMNGNQELFYGVGKKGYVLHSGSFSIAGYGVIAADSAGRITRKQGWHYYNDKNNIVNSASVAIAKNNAPKNNSRIFFCKQKTIKNINACWLITNTSTIGNNEYSFDANGYLTSLPSWADIIWFEQDGTKYAYDIGAKNPACGLTSVTEAIMILKKDKNLKPADVLAKLKNYYGVYSEQTFYNNGTGGNGILFGVKTTDGKKGYGGAPQLYGLKSGGIIGTHSWPNKNTVTDVKKRLQQGQMIIMHSTDYHSINWVKPGNNRKHSKGHTIMFYKYENETFYAKDTATDGGPSVKWSEKDFENFITTGSTWSGGGGILLVWVSK